MHTQTQSSAAAHARRASFASAKYEHAKVQSIRGSTQHCTPASHTREMHAPTQAARRHTLRSHPQNTNSNT